MIRYGPALALAFAVGALTIGVVESALERGGVGALGSLSAVQMGRLAAARAVAVAAVAGQAHHHEGVAPGAREHPAWCVRRISSPGSGQGVRPA